ncbi:GNAT family N-acetyltransferase [Schinkia azotoformans]|uniref:GCN5-like N-acetyltransferase n=1 Tax=Schinkia azotoformans LMG 9581 TaxID=1131731 RepID=K6E6U4_SCHAZ|nr:GNAT family N-acetyltransferase [Schinkia azotoformans]EKN68986.1 GCN5-like N-acetyltransferase [Schinkia azotoformans LMG 9581]MEC1638420.1 GNAT family N-acetyltransferase [Schinkia azotoformans]MEC1721277.1 GNAT family N-acetyltransferase [Schinkia azotoformans]MEC1946146.1 GNAT family N-acetyltransferase [Schinkia azotoformans]MED4352442.1 GNAT family N-acetyltransferase [Schinkia azotoformans]
MLTYRTFDYWDEEIWNRARPIYEEAFGKHGAKSTAVIRNMFRKQMIFLHIVMDETENNPKVVGMAITGKLKAFNSLLIDYLAIKKSYRNQGIGALFVHYIKELALTKFDCDSMVLEIEATEDPIHQKRIQFWEKCGFHLTDYIHDYKVVPEPYQAMYQKLTPQSNITTDGKELFKHLGNFHRKCFQGVKSNSIKKANHS